MKIFIKFLFVVLYSTLIFSCTSPTNVPANRVTTVDKSNENNNKPEEHIFSINPTELKFYDVPYQGSQNKSFTIYNNTGKPQVVSKITVGTYKDLFQLYSPKLPFTLMPKDQEGSKREIYISFYGKRLGETYDKMRINEIPELSISLSGYVPDVDLSDCDFGFVAVGKSTSKRIVIQNNGGTTALLRGYYLIDPDSVFEALSAATDKVLPGQQVYFYMRFTPKSDKPYNGRIEFDIVAPGLVDKNSELQGIGIKP